MTNKSHSKPKIAVVEDDREMRSILEDFLRLNGWVVDTFESAELFLQREKSHPTEKYSLVISDVHMPKISGMELLEELQRQKSGVPVLLITAAPNRQDEAKAAERGAIGYLRKPFGLTEVLSKVKQVLKAS